MITCLIDQIAENHEAPTVEAIEVARVKQLDALKELRRMLMQRRDIIQHNEAA